MQPSRKPRLNIILRISVSIASTRRIVQLVGPQDRLHSGRENQINLAGTTSPKTMFGSRLASMKTFASPRVEPSECCHADKLWCPERSVEEPQFTSPAKRRAKTELSGTSMLRSN